MHISYWWEKVKLPLCLTNLALLHEGVWGNRFIYSHFPDLGTSWSRVVSFTSLPHHPLDRRLGGPQSRSGQRWEEKILEPTGTRNPTPQSSSP
jgi:hypothetical protein